MGKTLNEAVRGDNRLALDQTSLAPKQSTSVAVVNEEILTR